MPVKTPFTFTAVSYVMNISDGEAVRCREEIEFEQVASSKGTYQFIPTKKTASMTEAEQLACDKKMMEHAGDILSDVLQNDIEWEWKRPPLLQGGKLRGEI